MVWFGHVLEVRQWAASVKLASGRVEAPERIGTVKVGTAHDRQDSVTARH